MSLKDKLASKLSVRYHKPGESASIVPSWDVRDSIPMIEGQTSAGTFTELNGARARGIRFSGTRVGSARRHGRAALILGRNLRNVPENVFPLALKHCLVILPCICIPILMSTNVSATASSLTVSVSSGQDPVINIPPTPSGIFAESGATTFSVNTTHAAGYSVVASSTALTDSTTTIPSHNIAAGIKASDYSDDTYASANNLNNTWGFKPSKYRSGGTTITNTGTNAVFLPAPISSSRTLDEVASATNNTYDIAIGTRIDHTTPISSYSSTITVTVTANPTPYTITYNQNTTDTVTSMPSPNPANDSSSSDTVSNAVSNTVPVRDGYSFKGWCSTTTSDETCTGTTYNPDGGGTNRNLTIDQTSSSNSFTLYAMWEANGPYMQDLTLKDCEVNVGVNGNATNVGDNITVYDKRDKNDYTVRYINGKCWMTRNLRFQEDSLNSITSNVAPEYTESSPYDIIWYSLKDTSGCKGTSATANNTTYMCKQNSDDETIGVWYNYSAATAHTITGTSNSNDATYDICPAGWHLPTGPNTTLGTDLNILAGNTTSGYQALTTGLSAFGVTIGGNYNNGSISNSTYGVWWSASAYSSSSRHLLSYNSSNAQFRASSYVNRYVGYSIRCVLKTPTMQDATSTSLAAAMPNMGDTTTLRDARDGQEYTVGRLADGNYWMLDNLALDLTDSNVKSKMLDSTDTKTNANYTTLNYLFNGGGSSPYTNYAVSSSWSTNYYNRPLINMASKDVIPSDATSTAGKYKVGGYYNYCAASAGSYCYSSSSSSGNATQDICPAGWRMPTGDPSGEFKTLYSNSSYNTYTKYRAALHLPLSGIYYSGSANFQGSRGYFWSSTRSNIDSMYALYPDTSSVIPAYNDDRYYGGSLRCILKTPAMQDATSESLAEAMPNVGDTATLRDARDDQEYTVAKLADGKYWMTKNLDLAGGKALSASDTDVTSDYISSFSGGSGLTKSGSTIVLPVSSTSGFDSDNYSYIYNTNSTNCNIGCYSYYSWDAATLGSGRSISTDNQNAPYSICPKGWKLPTTHSGTNSTANFRALMIAYGGSNSIQQYNTDTNPTGATMYGKIGPSTIPNFLRGGHYSYDSLTYGNSIGYYWSATSGPSSARARNLDLSSLDISSANYSSRLDGFSVRCLFNGS